MELISISNVNVRYKNGVNALHDISIKIKRGDFVFVIGGSESGKSTFIKRLYREIKPSSGAIILGGLNVAKLRDSKVYKLRRIPPRRFRDLPRHIPKCALPSIPLRTTCRRKSFW